MTRFNISLQEGVAMVLWTLEHALGTELLVPKIPSYRIMDVAEAIGPGCEKPIVGIRLIVLVVLIWVLIMQFCPVIVQAMNVMTAPLVSIHRWIRDLPTTREVILTSCLYRSFVS